MRALLKGFGIELLASCELRCTKNCVFWKNLNHYCPIPGFILSHHPKLLYCTFHFMLPWWNEIIFSLCFAHNDCSPTKTCKILCCLAMTLHLPFYSGILQMKSLALLKNLKNCHFKSEFDAWKCFGKLFWWAFKCDNWLVQPR